MSEKSGIVALLLVLFLGYLGAHRFYVGKTGTAILQIITLGGFGIWILIDIIMIVMEKFEDSEGNALKLK